MPYYNVLLREQEIEESIVVSITIVAGDNEFAFNFDNRTLELGDSKDAANFPKLIS